MLARSTSKAHLAPIIPSGRVWRVERAARRAVALRGRWRCSEPAIARCWRSRKATVPKEVLCGARSHWGCPPHDVRACCSSRCQVLALPLTHGPEGGGQWWLPTPRLQGVWCASRCGWRWKVANGLETSASCASTSGTERLRHFLIELHRNEVDIVGGIPQLTGKQVTST